jgi:hypothetical protein
MAEERTNPETEWLRQRLRKDRRLLRRDGMVCFLVGLCLLPVGIAGVNWAYSRPAASWWDALGVFIIFLGTPVSFLLLGVVQYLDGRKSVSHEEVENRRGRERRELFRMAQGKLPWRYSSVVLGVFAVLGLLFLIPGMLLLLDGTSYHTEGWVLGLAYSVCGILLLLYALVIFPRRRKRLPAQSARLLGSSLVAGEMTEGLQLSSGTDEQQSE